MVIDPGTAGLLQDIVRREGRSLLIYVGDAFPWTTLRESTALTRLRDLIGAERQAISDIAVFLQRQRMPLTFHGSYPASFTTINFVALKYLLPRLVAFERESIRVLEADLVRV